MLERVIEHNYVHTVRDRFTNAAHSIGRGDHGHTRVESLVHSSLVTTTVAA
jgi:hypothetical protein